MSRIQCANGLTLLHQQSTDIPLATIQVFFRSGYASEPAARAGIASLAGVLCSQETRSRGSDQLARELEDRGASVSSEVDADYAAISISLPSAHFNDGCALLADMALHPRFTDQELEKERASSLASLRSRQDQIFTVADDAFRGMLFGTHAYARTSLGTEQTLSAITRDDLMAWHHQAVTAGAIFIVVVGDVSLETARTAVERFFVGLKPGSEPSPRAGVVFEPPREKKLAGSKFEQSFVMTGFPAPALGDPSFPVLKFINALLGGRMSGRLFSILREQKSLAYEVSSFYPTRVQGSRFVIYLGLDARNIDTARSGIRAILRDLADHPVPESEITETKNFLRGAFLMDRQTITRRAWYLGYWEALGMGFDYADRYLEALMSVSASDIQRVSRAVLMTEPSTIIVEPGVH